MLKRLGAVLPFALIPALPLCNGQMLCGLAPLGWFSRGDASIARFAYGDSYVT